MAEPVLEITRLFDAPPERVFDAWLGYAWGEWVGPRDVHGEIIALEPRVGGQYRIVMHRPNAEPLTVSGIYREVVPNRRLVFSWAWQSTPERQSQVSIDLRPDGDGTMLTLTHEQFADQKACDDHRVGWTYALDNLERLFA